MPRRRRPVVTPKKVDLALKQVVADQAIERALLSVVNVLSEIARNNDIPLVPEQPRGGLRDDQ